MSIGILQDNLKLLEDLLYEHFPWLMLQHVVEEEERAISYTILPHWRSKGVCVLFYCIPLYGLLMRVGILETIRRRWQHVALPRKTTKDSLILFLHALFDEEIYLLEYGQQKGDGQYGFVLRKDVIVPERRSIVLDWLGSTYSRIYSWKGTYDCYVYRKQGCVRECRRLVTKTGEDTGFLESLCFTAEYVTEV